MAISLSTCYPPTPPARATRGEAAAHPHLHVVGDDDAWVAHVISQVPHGARAHGRGSTPRRRRCGRCAQSLNPTSRIRQKVRRAVSVQSMRPWLESKL